MADEALLIARVLFWILAAGVVFLPTRWAFFCFIVASHLDITSLTFTSATAVGFENAVRIAGMPTLLLCRTGLAPFKELSWSLPQKLWVLLAAYAAVAGLWSSFSLSAFKMIVYLVAYFVLYVVLCEGWENRWLDVGLMRLVAWCVMALAVAQTYLLDNTFGMPEDRFTSFSAPQYFAACLVALLAILVFSGDKGFFHYATCVVLILGIVLSGSRYVLLSTVALVVIACFQGVPGRDGSLRWRPNLKKLLIAVATIGALAAVLFSYLPYNRLDELATAAADDEGGVEDVGTLAWRLGIYADIFERLGRRTGTELFFGSGTSSGAALMLNHDPDHYDREGIDGNRVLHSEFLRALYEWGIPGFGLLVAFVIAATAGYVKKIVAEGGGPALAFAGAWPSIVLGLAIENMLASAASAGGVGILLAMTFAWKGESIEAWDGVVDTGLDARGVALSVRA